MKLGRSGFSLVEITVAIAIVGILSAVSIPTYQNMQRRSKRSEAKLLLGSLHKSELMFKSEWGMYSTRFNALGFQPEGQLRFNIGFTQDFATTPPGANGGTNNCVRLCPNNCPGTFGKWTCTVESSNNLDANVVATARRNAFLAGAHLHWENAGGVPESWTINQRGQIFFIIPAY